LYFSQSSSSAIERINDWVAENTKQKIKNFLSENDVSALTKLILVNAIYFKRNWQLKFDVNATTEQDFHVSETETSKVQLMFMSKVKMEYGKSKKLNCRAIELPYMGRDKSMFVILPDHTKTNIHAVERSLTAGYLVNITDSFGMYKTEVNIWLPRFKLDEKLELGDLLSKMGIVDLFSEDRADLSGVSKSGGLFVSKAIHRAQLEVNEDGSQASATTRLVITGRRRPPPVEDFRADHPFLFFIRDKKTNSVLFLGRFVKPVAKPLV